MQKLLILFLFISFLQAAHGQVIKGSVKDQQSGNRIPHASVYFSGTFLGVSADQNGNFTIDITKYPSRQLTISAVGYYSSKLSDFSPGEPHIIYLAPKIYELDEVVFGDESLSRQKEAYLKLFRKEFLGHTSNARRCEILNEKDITFNYGSDNDTLKAYALKPIVIHNRALGYEINYFLDSFQYCKKRGSLSFTGNIIFKEDSITLRRFSERRRRLTYLGSRMHFCRSLWANDLKSNNFTIWNRAGKNLKYESIVIQKDNEEKFLSYTEDISITRYANWSSIHLLNEQILFDQDGFFDPSGIRWQGQMAKKRIADWLPYEYEVDR
ncbi:MAG: carboxypeptidase-like regulatory domain-containing protein [Bacteroidota bacterium]